MTTFEAVEILEMTPDATIEQQTEAWQSLIDSGAVWQLQGAYGRGAVAMIQSGVCTPRAVLVPRDSRTARNQVRTS